VKAVFSRRCQTLSGPPDYRRNVSFGESIAGSFLVAIVATKVAVLRRRKRENHRGATTRTPITLANYGEFIGGLVDEKPSSAQRSEKRTRNCVG
jgi:hypothetical protein